MNIQKIVKENAPSRFFYALRSLHAVLVGLDHFLDHLAADAAGLTGSQITVVALLEIHADLRGGFHLEAIHGLAGLGVDELIAVVAGHSNASPFLVDCVGESAVRRHIITQSGKDMPDAWFVNFV